MDSPALLVVIAIYLGLFAINIAMLFDVLRRRERVFRGVPQSGWLVLLILGIVVPLFIWTGVAYAFSVKRRLDRAERPPK